MMLGCKHRVNKAMKEPAYQTTVEKSAQTVGLNVYNAMNGK
jgi:hypothetical protein